jgi:L-iditol 2-dehydrogenase
MTGSMLAAMYYGVRDVRVEEVPIPQIGPGDILLKIGAATTCGTDIKMYRRSYPDLPQLPMLYGHECAGVAAEVGKDVEGVKVGDRIVAGINAPCGRCFFCKRGQPVFCENRTFGAGGGSMAGGAYAEYLFVPDVIVRNNIHHIPESLSYEEAALIEPLGCVLYAVEDVNIRLGDTVAINGCGAIGLMFLRLAKLQGARVISSGRNPMRLKMAEELGADVVIDVGEVDDQIAAVREAAGEPGPDVVIEATGLPEVWELSINMVRRGGEVMLFGGCKPGTSINLDTRRMHYDCLTLKSPSVYHQTPDMLKRCLRLLESGGVPGKKLISKRMPLESVVEAIETHMSGGGIKIAVIPPDFWDGQ